MASIRPDFWTALLLAMILVSLVIVIIFIIINVCISKRAARNQPQTNSNHYSDPKLKNENNQVCHSDFKNEKPSLPPRDQFQSTNSVNQSYEDLVSTPDYIVVEGSTSPAPQQSFPPHYTTVQTKSQDLEDIPDYDDVEIPNCGDSEDYDDVG